jgi:hypothetical protein
MTMTRSASCPVQAAGDGHDGATGEHGGNGIAQGDAPTADRAAKSPCPGSACGGRPGSAARTPSPRRADCGRARLSDRQGTHDRRAYLLVRRMSTSFPGRLSACAEAVQKKGSEAGVIKHRIRQHRIHQQREEGTRMTPATGQTRDGGRTQRIAARERHRIRLRTITATAGLASVLTAAGVAYSLPGSAHATSTQQGSSASSGRSASGSSSSGKSSSSTGSSSSGAGSSAASSGLQGSSAPGSSSGSGQVTSGGS